MSAPGNKIEVDAEGSVSLPEAPDPTIIVQGDGEDTADTKVVAGAKPITTEDIASLRQELEAAKADRDVQAQSRTRAEAAAREANRRGVEATGQWGAEVENRLYSEETAVDAGLSSLQGELSSLEQVSAKAMEDGKFPEAAAAQRKMADAIVRQRELGFRKVQIQNYRANLAAQAKQFREQPPHQATNDIGGAAVGQKTQDWIARHPKFNSDAAYQAKAMQGHYAALAQGLKPDTDDYFKVVEMTTGDRQPEGAGGNTKTRDSEDGVDGSGVAPVQRRATNTNGGGRPGSIKLSADEVMAADSMFGEEGNPLYIKEPAERYRYWNSQKDRLKKEGRLSNG